MAATANASLQYMQACSCNDSSVCEPTSLSMMRFVSQSPSYCLAWWTVNKVLVRQALSGLQVTLAHSGSLLLTFGFSDSELL